MYESIIYSTDGPVATIKLNRPEKLNAFGGAMREEILSALELVAADEAIRVLIVTGEGRGFSAGGDIDHLKKRADSLPAAISITSRSYVKRRTRRAFALYCPQDRGSRECSARCGSL
jgi:enoyl-CoA hydratase/carnithine racemase